MMKNRLLTTLVAAVTVAGMAACEPLDDGDNDSARLTRFRQAIPTTGQLEAPQVEGTTPFALGDPALYPAASLPIVLGVNGSVAVLIALLEGIVSLPPTVFNSDTQEYVWGPFPNDDGVGFVAVYIKDTGTAEDFRYQYALLRGITNDLALLTPVIVGGATPDPNDDDNGFGLTMWDFEADRAFNEAHDPNFDPDAGDRGRFVALYGAGPDEDEPGNEMAFVVAALRDFVAEDDAGAEATDLDYFYGRYITSENTIDFIDFETSFDVDDPADGTAEDVGVRLAFLDEGIGRAEADAINGSLAPNGRGDVVECWDSAINQTFLSLEVTDGGTVVATVTDGDPADCGLFDATLDELNIPSLQSVDAGLLAALDQLASTGSFD